MAGMCGVKSLFNGRSVHIDLYIELNSRIPVAVNVQESFQVS